MTVPADRRNDSPAPILDLMNGFRRSKTLFVAVHLGVFDGARPAVPRLAQLLEACTALGLLTKAGDDYRNTEVADRYLRRASHDSLADYIGYSDRVLYRLWSHLEDAVATGSNRWSQAFGSEAAAVRADVFSGPEFALGMRGSIRLSARAIIDAVDLSHFGSLVDLGGGTGELGVAAKRRYPSLRVTLFDTLDTIELARRLVHDDIDFIAGDFCTDDLPRADVFVISRILHHRSAEQCVSLLTRLHDALTPGGMVLIAEALLDDDRSGPAEAHMQSLNMLVCSDGEERTAGQYRHWLELTGFRDVTVHRTGTPLDCVFGIRAPHSQSRPHSVTTTAEGAAR
jgi:acetylserotonin N-methyltransferase